MATPVQLRRMVRYIFPMGKHSPRAGWCILLLDRYNHVFLIFILIDKHNYLLDFLSQLIAMKMWVMDSRPEGSEGSSRRVYTSGHFYLYKLIMFYFYMLKCVDNSFYIGHTDDLEKRMAEHAGGDGCVYTSKRLPVQLVYVEVFSSRDEAFIAERKIKKWTRVKKRSFGSKELG